MKQLRANLTLLLGTLVGLSGCGTLDGKFENVPTCAIGESKAYVISLYGPVGISAELTKASAKVLCPASTTTVKGN